MSKFLLLLLICSFRLTANAQSIEAVGDGNPVNLPEGSYYFDSYKYDQYSESVFISDNTIIREKTNRHKETYKNTYTVTHSYEVAKDLYLLFTENEAAGYDKTLFMMIIQFREDGINLNKTFFWESTKAEYYDLVNVLKGVNEAYKKETLFQKKLVTLYQYYPKEKYNTLKNLHTVTVSQLPKLSTKLIEHFFTNEDEYYTYLYKRREGYSQVTELELGIFNFMIDNGFQPYTSTRIFFEYATGTDGYQKKYKEIKRSSRSKMTVFFEKLGKAFKLLGTLAIVWLVMALFLRYKNRSKLKDIKQNQAFDNHNGLLLPRFLKPFLNIIAICGFSVIGGYLGFSLGWNIAQTMTPNNDGGLADIFIAVVGLITTSGGGLAFGVWIVLILNKTMYKTA